jgi:hypothetical protein
MYSVHKFLCVPLYSRFRSVCNFVCLITLLQLSSSNRFLFLYSLIYSARLLPADILSVRDVIRWQLGYSIALCPSLCALIWLLSERVGVKVTLRLAVYRQTVRLGDKPLEVHGQISFFQLDTCGHSPYVTSSLTRGWVCRRWSCRSSSG